MFTQNTQFEIESPEGWVEFDGIQTVHKDDVVCVGFDDGTEVECSTNHKFFDDQEREVTSVDLDSNIIMHKDGVVKVVSSKTIQREVVLYDIVNSGPKHRFYHDGGVVSHNCSFLGSVGTLIPSKDLKRMISKIPINLQHTYDDDNNIIKRGDDDDDLKVYYEYEEGGKYVGVADVGEGLGQDYSVLDIFDVSSYPYKVVAKYRNNNIAPIIFPYTVVSICKQYGNCPVLMEVNNDVGGQASTILYNEIEYEGVICTSNDAMDSSGIRIGGRKSRPGIKTTKKTKRIGCANLKALIERDMLIIEDMDTITELGQFIRVRESYEADKGCHDDCVMPLVIFSWLVKQDWFMDMFDRTDVGKDIIQTMQDKEIEEIFPFGCISDEMVDNEYDELEFDDDDTDYGGVSVYEGNMSMDQWMSA